MSRPSAIGFGRQLFGDHPFGSADWAEEVTWGVLPQFIKDDDTKLDLDPKNPLRKTINAWKPQFQEIIDKYDLVPSLWDANKVPISQLKNLAYNFDISLNTLKSVESRIVATIDSTNNPLDLSTLSIDPEAPIEPGTFVLTVTRADDVEASVRDDGNGNLSSATTIPAGATLDYVSGNLSGITTSLKEGSNVTVSYIFSLKDTALQRSEVLNAIQFFLNKGIDKGYEIAAALSGLLVTVTPRWSDSCGQPANLTDQGPTKFFATFNTFPADKIPADKSFDDFFAKWPNSLTWDDSPCRSSFLKLFFYPPDDIEIENFSAVAEDVINNIERVRPIHVRFESIRFDGPRATSGVWSLPIIAENSASSSTWSASVISEIHASSNIWSGSVAAAVTV